MTFDSATLCARTTAGEAELATPSQGLSLGQRRVLTLLQNPSAIDELAERYRLEPEKLARDLTRLADLKLIQLHGPATAAAAATPPPADTSMAPVVIGRSARRSPALPLLGGVAVILLAVGIWYGTRAHEPAGVDQTPAAPASVASAAAVGTPPPASAPPAPAVRSAPDSVPAIATVLRGNAPPAEFRPDIRPGLMPAAANVGVSNAAAPKPADKPAPAPDSPAHPVAAAAPTMPAPVAAVPVTAPAAPPPTATTANAPAEPPIQLAAAAPTAAPARPAVVTELKPISRDAPDFPREAIAAGITKGVVSARIHVDPNGKVTAVDILGGQPQHVFDRAVRNALSRWQFEPIATARTSDVEINFQRE